MSSLNLTSELNINCHVHLPSSQTCTELGQRKEHPLLLPAYLLARSGIFPPCSADTAPQTPELEPNAIPGVHLFLHSSAPPIRKFFHLEGWALSPYFHHSQRGILSDSSLSQILAVPWGWAAPILSIRETVTQWSRTWTPVSSSPSSDHSHS